MPAILTRPSEHPSRPLVSTSSALLGFDQEQALGRQLTQPGAGREPARQQLILANQRLVWKIARQFQNAPVAFEDLVQEGMLGLINAVDHFDYKQGVRFSTYAVWWIRQAILSALNNQGRLIRMPAHVYESLRRVQQARQRLGAQMGRTPSLTELAQEVGMEEVKVTELLAAAILPLSFDAPIGDEQEGRLGDLLPAPDSCDPLMQATRQSVGQSLRDALQILTPQEQQVLTARYGLDGEDPRTLDELSRAMKFSRERLRKIETLALQKLRRNAALRSLSTV